MRRYYCSLSLFITITPVRRFLFALGGFLVGSAAGGVGQGDDEAVAQVVLEDEWLVGAVEVYFGLTESAGLQVWQAEDPIALGPGLSLTEHGLV